MKESPPRESQRLEAGEWRGEYLDVYGRHGKLTLRLAGVGAGLAGEYELTLRSEDAPQVLRGRVRAVPVETGVRFELDQEKGAPLAFHAQVRPAGGHAQQAIVGLVDAPAGSGLGGGVWIAWKYSGTAAKG